MNIVIIGGSAAGYNAAVNLRKRYPEAGITLISEEACPFYDRRKLLDYWLDKVKDKDLLLTNLDNYSRQNINFLKESKVIAVNPARRSVSYKVNEKRTSVDYDFLVIASGSKTPLPESVGINKTGVFRFDGFADFKELKSALMHDMVCLIGTNYLTPRVIDCIISRKIEVKLITHEPQENFPAPVEAINSQVVEIIGDSGVQAIKLKEGKIIGVSWVGVMLEPAPNTDFLEEAGIERNGKAIAVDEFMRTNLPDIFACGSVCLLRGQTPKIKSWDESAAEGLAVSQNLLKS
jgi:NAD(P)H-nitrite reductase large subunit